MFRKTARNFNPPAAMCGKICVVEVEEIVPTGSLDPDTIHLPGIYVHRIVRATTKNASNSAQCEEQHNVGIATKWRRAPHRNCKTAGT